MIDAHKGYECLTKMQHIITIHVPWIYTSLTKQDIYILCDIEPNRSCTK